MEKGLNDIKLIAMDRKFDQDSFRDALSGKLFSGTVNLKTFQTITYN